MRKKGRYPLNYSVLKLMYRLLVLVLRQATRIGSVHMSHTTAAGSCLVLMVLLLPMLVFTLILVLVLIVVIA